MLPVKTLIKRIRRVVHDVDAITYDDDEILAVINQGVRSIRRIICDNRPEKLVEPVVTGMIKPGEYSIEMPYTPLMLLYVRIGTELISSETTYESDKIYHNYNLIYHNKTPIYAQKTVNNKYRTQRIDEANLSEIYGDMTREGAPEVYYLTGDRTVNVYPVPREETYYEILAVRDFEDLTLDDETPLMNECDDLLLEFANVRLSIENEYDVSADSQVMSNLQSQIMRILHIPTTGITVQGYWSENLDRFGKPARRMW